MTFSKERVFSGVSDEEIQYMLNPKTEGYSYFGGAYSLGLMQRAGRTILKLRAALSAGFERQQKALERINNIRNSIIGLQSINWSEHVYPLVAALEDAGIQGMDYPEARENYGTMLERTVIAEDRNDALTAELEQVKAELAASTPQPGTVAWGAPLERVRHVKRGTEYEVLHRGVELQVVTGRNLSDYDCLVIYQGTDGKLWAREESEFDDGRFVSLPTAPACLLGVVTPSTPSDGSDEPEGGR